MENKNPIKKLKDDFEKELHDLIDASGRVGVSDVRTALDKIADDCGKSMEEKVVGIIEDCKTHRGIFIWKKELTNKLEEAFPDV